MELDVAIVGGGLAGATLARQLRRTLPQLSVGLFERDDDGGFKVGESTVEIAANYLTRRLGLTNYLYQNHLPKNGVRFFFDDADRNAELVRLGEIGTDALPYHPGFQLDRQRLDADLRRMNREDGVDVQVGVTVSGLQPGRDGARHGFTVRDGDRERTVKARWLVDASGRARLHARALGEHRGDTGHQLAAAWGRFTGVADLDDAGTPAWRARVRNTSRTISTVHFMYAGYWIWFIPIARGVTSVGVVCEADRFRDAWRTPEGLRAFVQEHRAAGELLAPATCLDAMGFAKVPYTGGAFFGADRWARVGEANAFSDPLYSPGSDFIAIENDLTCELIAREFAGASESELAADVALFDAFVQFRFDAALALYRDLYPCFGSRRLFSLKWEFDIHNYYNLWFHAYARDQHLDRGWLREQLGLRGPILAQLYSFARLFREAAAVLQERGDYFRDNLDHYHQPLRILDFIPEVGTARARKPMLRLVSAISNRTRAEVLALLEPGRKVEPWPLGAYMFERDLRAEASP